MPYEESVSYTIRPRNGGGELLRKCLLLERFLRFVPLASRRPFAESEGIHTIWPAGRLRYEIQFASLT